jgi:hypothetical protein
VRARIGGSGLCNGLVATARARIAGDEYDAPECVERVLDLVWADLDGMGVRTPIVGDA